MPRNTIIVDVDGVVADFSDHLLRSIDAHLTSAAVTNWDIFGFLTAHERKAAEEVLEDPHFWHTQPVLPGAQEGIAQIRSAGLQVTWCTSPWVSCKSWEHARRAWLKEHFGSVAGDVIIAANKHLIRGAAFLDDKPSHVEAWGEVNGHEMAHLFDSHHNQTAQVAEHRRITWSGIQRLIDAVRRPML